MSDSKINFSFPSVWTILGCIFIYLKLTGAINWAWVWVLAPFWIGLAIFAIFLLFFLLIGIIVALYAANN